MFKANGPVRMAVLALVVVSGAGRPSNLTPTAIHRLAEEAYVVRGLLRLEDALTYDAVALKPKRTGLARRIRSGNGIIIALCNGIIRDDARIATAEKELHAHTASGANVTELVQLVAKATADVEAKMRQIKAKGENISIADLFEMQMLMNHLSQLSEMSTSVVSASNSAISSMARGIKS
jgi:hypothetical protein